jgi:hypothetical protein
MSILDDYQELAATGVSGGGGGEKTDPKDEFFKSVYIAGQNRKHENGVLEEIEKLQIRGHSFNHQEVLMIITHVKDILNNETKESGNMRTKCFSFKESSAPPWYGSQAMPDGSPRVCPTKSGDRKGIEFCKTCKAQIIVAGILCQPTGTPILDDEKKPIFVFIRGKGVKYGNVSDYLSELYNLDLNPVFKESGDEIREFEKRVVNHKRFVTKISQGYADTNHGQKLVFEFERGNEINSEFAVELLELAKNTMDQFRKKFDWSKKKTSGSATQAKDAKKAGVMTMDSGKSQPETEEKVGAPPETKTEDAGTFSFKDIKF